MPGGQEETLCNSYSKPKAGMKDVETQWGTEVPTRAKIVLLSKVDHWALSKLKENNFCVHQGLVTNAGQKTAAKEQWLSQRRARRYV